MPFPFRKKEKGDSMKKYVVIYTNDSIDPMVYGIFSLEKAKKVKDKLYDKFDHYDWSNEAQLQIEELRSIK